MGDPGDRFSLLVPCTPPQGYYQLDSQGNPINLYNPNVGLRVHYLDGIAYDPGFDPTGPDQSPGMPAAGGLSPVSASPLATGALSSLSVDMLATSAPSLVLPSVTAIPWPTRLIDLFSNRVGAASNAIEYYRESARTNNADVVPDTDVKPTWIAGLWAPLANTWTRSGTLFRASMAMRTWPTSERELFGASTSW